MMELNDRVFHALGLRESERMLVQDFVAMNMQCIQGKVTKEVLAVPLESTIQLYLRHLKQELDAFIVGQSGFSIRLLSSMTPMLRCLQSG